MTPDAIRIAIAEACGWKWVKIPDSYRPGRMMRTLGFHGEAADMTETAVNPEWMWREARIPDYLNDLNPIHEAEKLLTDSQCQLYIDNLVLATNATLSTNDIPYGADHLCIYNATTAQRCEAFLRTLNLWTPVPSAVAPAALDDREGGK